MWWPAAFPTPYIWTSGSVRRTEETVGVGLRWSELRRWADRRRDSGRGRSRSLRLGARTLLRRARGGEGSSGISMTSTSA
jgi:hypothetical protein